MDLAHDSPRIKRRENAVTLRLCTWLIGAIGLLRFKVRRSIILQVGRTLLYISAFDLPSVEPAGPTCGGACRDEDDLSAKRRNREENRGLPATFLAFTSANHGKFSSASKYPANRLTVRENSTLLSTARPRKIVKNCVTTQDGLSYAEFAEYVYIYPSSAICWLRELSATHGKPRVLEHQRKTTTCLDTRKYKETS